MNDTNNTVRPRGQHAAMATIDDCESTESSDHAAVPGVLDRNQAEILFDDLLREYKPKGPVEIAIIKDLARRLAAAERWGAASEAVERHAAQSLSGFDPGVGQATDREDAVLAAAMGTDVADRCERQSLGHSRASYRALQKLEEIQARRKKRESADGDDRPRLFPDEKTCEEWLVKRFEQESCPCPKCGGTVGYYFPARKSWECQNCKTQVGLRADTVMSRSPIPLKKWFDAINWLLSRPTMSAAELAEKIAISRLATVRSMKKKIGNAMAADNASDLLAGLDHPAFHDAHKT